MIDIKNKIDCCGCSACMNICPKQCIEMQRDEEGFLYPKIVNIQSCINCNLCELHCPILNNTNKENGDFTKIVMGCRNKDLNVLLKSSSGGIFDLLAKHVLLNENGVVFGAAFDKNNILKHSSIDKYNEINTLRGSKYVQSIIGSTYKEIKSLLLNNKIVLFVGTPCQVAGLLTFLKRKYTNLYTIDFICHGVPSPLVWDYYIRTLPPMTKNINFRDKCYGWRNYCFSYTYEKNNKTHKIIEKRNKNIFMKGFLNDIFLRPSCYKCKFKNFTSGSDITLSDFWGVWKNYPRWNDNKGASCVSINSIKGESLFNRIDKNNYEKIDITFKKAYIDYNHSSIYSTKYNKKREIYFSKLNQNSFVELTNKLTKASTYSKIKNLMSLIYNIIKK